MLTTETHPARRLRLHGAALRHRPSGGPPGRPGPQHHQQPLYLRALAGRLLHGLDLLRQRRARRRRRPRFSPHLHRPDPAVRPGLGGPAQDRPHQQSPPHHVHRRLHRLALRQEQHPGEHGGGHRRAGHHPLHRPSAQGHLHELYHHQPVPSHCHAAVFRGHPRVRGHRVLRGTAARAVRDPLRHPPPGCHRAARGAGRRHRLRIDRQAGRVSVRRPFRDLWHVPGARRPVREGGGPAPAAGALHLRHPHRSILRLVA